MVVLVVVEVVMIMMVFAILMVMVSSLTATSFQKPAQVVMEAGNQTRDATKTRINTYTGDGSYGASRLGSRGNIEDLRMFFRPRYNITTLSSPMPPPPWGTTPCLKESV